VVTKSSITFDGTTTTQALSKAGTWINVNNYSLPTASSTVKGGIKVGDTLAIASEVLNLKEIEREDTTSTASPAYGETFTSVDDVTTDDYGRVTGINLKTVTLPADSHYTTHLYAGDGTAANKATTNGNTKVTITDNTTVRNSVTIRGTGTTIVTSDANGVITINSADSKTGTVTSITPGDGLLNGTGTTAITTSGTLNINYGTSTSKIGTASAGTAKTVSRSDHVHAIDLATGDANGQVKIAGTNIDVKGLGSAAYTESSAYATAGHNHNDVYVNVTGDTMTGLLNL